MGDDDEESTCSCCALEEDSVILGLSGGRCDDCSSGFCPMGYCSDNGEFYDDDEERLV